MFDKIAIIGSKHQMMGFYEDYPHEGLSLDRINIAKYRNSILKHAHHIDILALFAIESMFQLTE